MLTRPCSSPVFGQYKIIGNLILSPVVSWVSEWDCMRPCYYRRIPFHISEYELLMVPLVLHRPPIMTVNPG